MTDKDRRKLDRAPLGIQGSLLRPDGTPVRLCTIEDISAEGARVSVLRPEDLPDTVMLVLPTQSTGRECKIAWRSSGEIGVEFVTPAR
jgi:hypothetical protein